MNPIKGVAVSLLAAALLVPVAVAAQSDPHKIPHIHKHTRPTTYRFIDNSAAAASTLYAKSKIVQQARSAAARFGGVLKNVVLTKHADHVKGNGLDPGTDFEISPNRQVYVATIVFPNGFDQRNGHYGPGATLINEWDAETGRYIGGITKGHLMTRKHPRRQKAADVTRWLFRGNRALGGKRIAIAWPSDPINEATRMS